MRNRIKVGWLVGVVGLVGCGSGEPIVTHPSQLKPQTEEEVRVSKEMDQKINEEEGGSFGAKSPKRPGSGR